MSNSINPTSQSPSWELSKDLALESDNLEADIRVSDSAVQIRPAKNSLWQNIKWFFSKTNEPALASKEETLAHLKNQLEDYFTASMQGIIKETGIYDNKEECKLFIRAAEKALDEITTKLTTTNRSLSTSQAIQKAHEETLLSLMSLRKQFAKPDATPQIISLKDANGNLTGKYCIITPVALPENIVLSGGGAKGDAYVGAYLAMEETGVLVNLQRIAGSSAGAITAACIAGGLTADDLAKITAIPGLDLLVGESKNSVIDQADKLAPGPGFKGTAIVDILNQKISVSIKNYLNEVDLNTLDLSRISQDEKSVIAQLKEALNSEGEEKVILITFQQLSILHKINPSRFKELTITGFDATKGKEKYYNAVSTPHITIAEAVRISMALPIVFEGIDVKGDLMRDGGIGSNIPAEVFVKSDQEMMKKMPADLHSETTNYQLLENITADAAPLVSSDLGANNVASETLVLGFDGEGSFQSIVYGENVLIPDTLIETVEAFLSTNPKLRSSQTADNLKLWNAGPNALDVYHGNLGTVSFAASQSEVKAAQHQATVRMLEQLSLRQNQATYEVVDDLNQAMISMTDEQLKAIVATYKEGDLALQTEADPVLRAARQEITDRSEWEVVK
ncbi:MAG: patatin-like phospholipase family protein [Chthoniobacterales bacterium]